VHVPDAQVIEAPTAIGAGVGDPGGDRPLDQPGASRSELRVARKRRRRLMVVCALVIAVCVVLTVAVVGLARNRPVRSTPLSSAVLSVAPTSPSSVSTPIPLVSYPSTRARRTSV
jgi:hypothetical protein